MKTTAFAPKTLIIKPPEEREIIQQRVLMCQLKKAATFIIKKKTLTYVHEKKGLGSLAEKSFKSLTFLFSKNKLLRASVQIHGILPFHISD